MGKIPASRATLGLVSVTPGAARDTWERGDIGISGVIPGIEGHFGKWGDTLRLMGITLGIVRYPDASCTGWC